MGVVIALDGVSNIITCCAEGGCGNALLSIQIRVIQLGKTSID
jgi:hypothetical protein